MTGQKGNKATNDEKEVHISEPVESDGINLLLTMRPYYLG